MREVFSGLHAMCLQESCRAVWGPQGLSSLLSWGGAHLLGLCCAKEGRACLAHMCLLDQSKKQDPFMKLRQGDAIQMTRPGDLIC